MTAGTSGEDEGQARGILRRTWGLRRLWKLLAPWVPAGSGPRPHRERRKRRPGRRRRRRHAREVSLLGGLTPFDAPDFYDGKPDGD